MTGLYLLQAIFNMNFMKLNYIFIHISYQSRYPEHSSKQAYYYLIIFILPPNIFSILLFILSLTPIKKHLPLEGAYIKSLTYIFIWFTIAFCYKMINK